ncbi:hypothetical protein HCA60_16585, partial [Listeria booriae]|nr:hypothetical protein [Listeria booriae]
VGTETQIISPQVYEALDQTKFLPILFELDPQGKPYTPVYLATRLFIDLSGDGSSYRNAYEQVLRNIYKLPDERKPILGTKPSFLENPAQDTFAIERRARIIRNLADTAPKRVTIEAKDFLDSLIDDIPEFFVQNNDDEEKNKQIYEKIQGLLPIKVAYTSVLDSWMQTGLLDSIKLATFFEDCYNKIYELMGSDRSINKWQLESCKFLHYELFLETISKLLKYEEWESLRYLINYKYHSKERGMDEDFDAFSYYFTTLEDVSLQREKDTYNISQLLLYERADNKRMFQDLVQADLFLYYVAFIRNQKGWFPVTYPNLKDRSKVIANLKSKQHLTNLLMVLEVNEDTLKQKIKEQPSQEGYREIYDTIPLMSRFIDINNIGANI